MLWMSAFAGHGKAGQRIALIVTNQAYTHIPRLKNTHRDGDLLKTALEKVGFTVWVERDTADERTLIEAIGEHLKRLEKAGPDTVGFFYYSGHGAAYKGENYLLPAHAPITHAAQLPLWAVKLEKVMESLSRAGEQSIVVFDACRDTGLESADKAAVKGLAPVHEQSGLLVAFATGPGSVAADENLYARALAETLVQPDLDVAQVFRRVREKVEKETKGAQKPEHLDRLYKDFYFISTKPEADCIGLELLAGTEKICRRPGDADEFKDCLTCPEMVLVQAGEFTMGNSGFEFWSNRKPAHKVFISRPFAVSRFTVTFDEWDACVAAGGCNGYAPGDEGWGRLNRPVINVSWQDAKAYVAWLSQHTGKPYRLLSEAEREYVTQDGQWRYPEDCNCVHYKLVPVQDHNGIFQVGRARLAKEQTLPVEEFNPNKWGLYQVHGNVAEWVEDCWNSSFDGAPRDGTAWTAGNCKYRVIKGSSWNSEADEASMRNSGKVKQRDSETGFRVARSF